MLVVKGSIFRNVSPKEAEKLKQQGYKEVEKPVKPKSKG